MTELKELIEEFNEKLKEEKYYAAHQVVKQAIREFMGVKSKQEELHDFLDQVLLKYNELNLGLKAEIIASLLLLSLIMNDLTAAGVLDEQLKKLNEDLSENVALVQKLYYSRVKSKGVVFSLQEIQRLTLLGHYYKLQEIPLLITDSLEPIQQFISKYFEEGIYILSVLEDKTNLLQDIKYNTSKPEEVEVYQDIYTGEL